MVRRTGFRIQDSGFRTQKAEIRNQNSKARPGSVFVLLSAFCFLISGFCFSQQPQAQQGQPLYAANAKYVNGVAPGYWPTAGTGLTLNLSTGTALCGNPLAPVNYAGGTLSMTAATTNFVYLDPAGSCLPASNTSGFNVGQIPIAVVVTNASTITAVNDVRSFFSPPLTQDSTGRSIFKGLNGVYFADQLGDKSTTGIGSAIAICGTSTPCQVVVPGDYPTTEQVPGTGGTPGTTSSNVQVFDYRQGDQQTAINPQGPGGGHRPWHLWVDNQYTPPPLGTYWSHTVFSPVMNALGGGVLLDNASLGYYSKSWFSAMEPTINDYTPSSSSGIDVFYNKYSVGDSVPLEIQNTFYGGLSTQGEEGAEGADIWIYQGNVAYQGTIASGGSTGSTSLTLSPTAGSGTQGAGRYLLDTTTGKTITAGTISAITNSPGTGPAIFTGSGTSWPVSTVNTTSTQPVNTPGVQTVNLASTSGITTSTVLVFADASAYETVIPTAVGSGSITASFYAPHSSGAIVCAGGLSGYFVALTADTVPATTTGGTALQQAFPVLCSTSPTSMNVYIDAQGTWQGLSSGSGTQWANTSGQNGYVLYQGAEVLSVYANGAVGNTFTLMSNTVAWANGDTIEEPQHPANGARLGSWNLQSWWPAYGMWGPDLSFFGIHGPGTAGMVINNNTPTSVYSSGNLQPPFALFSIHGPWQTLMDVRTPYPNVTGMSFSPPAWGTASVDPIIIYPSSGSPDYLNYNSGIWRLTVGNQSGSYSFGPTSMSLPSHFGTSSSDAAGSLTISSSTSATVNFGTSYNTAPKCVVTPTSDPTSVGAYWATSTTSGFTVSVHTSGTITFSYICMGNPN
jgi:hypothetical protein